MELWIARTIAAVLIAAAPPSASSSEEPGPRTYHVGGYSVSAPEPGDWSATQDEANGNVLFARKETRGPLPVVARATTIYVGINRTRGEQDRMTEEEVAEAHRDGELQDMRVRGVATGEYDLEDVKKGVEMVGEKKLYVLRYATKVHPESRRGGSTRSILYLWFPSQFARTRQFLMIHIGDTCTVGEVATCPDVQAVLGVIRSLTAIGAPLGASATSVPAHFQAGILAFYAPARDRAASPPDEKKLIVTCQRQLQGANVPADDVATWISFLGVDPGRVLIAAFTREKLVDPVKVIALHVGDPMRTRIPGGQGTLDWGYVYDRNGDGRVDYLVYLQNALPVLPDPLPADFPTTERDRNGMIKATTPLLRAYSRYAQMVFRHYADDDFDGKVDAAIIEEFDAERPMFVKGWLAFRASEPGAEVDEAWAFRRAINDRQRMLDRGTDGFLVPKGWGVASEPIGTFLARASELVGAINDALSECKLGPESLERAVR